MELEHLLKVIHAVSESSLSELKYEEKGVKLSLQKEVSGVVTVKDKAEGTSALAAADFSEEKKGHIIKSPLVGHFYAAPSEGAAPFVQKGDKVEKGQTVAIIEAMKLMNDIESEYSGEIAEIYVENGAAVEYGQPLFRIQ